MLTVKELSTITKELVLGLEPSNNSPEAMEARCEIKKDLDQMEKDGIMPELPCDLND